MKQLLLHWRQRWRMPALRLLFMALLVSVTVVTTVEFFTNRVENAMQQQAQHLLGGDLVLVSSRPLSADYLQQARALGLETAHTISLSTMVSLGEQWQLSQLKAVSEGYPLRGELRVAPAVDAPEVNVTGQLPGRGELWAEARLFAALGAKPGARVQVGRSHFTLTRVLTHEPERGNNLFQLAPVVLMNAQDLPATQLLSPASRASFSQLFAGDARKIQQWQTALKPLLKPTERIRTVKEDLASVQQTLQRATRFLGLAAVLSVVLAGAAVVLTATSLVRRQLSAVAVLKAMGMSRQQVLWDNAFSLLLTALLAAALGVLLGLLLQWGLGLWLAEHLGKVLPAPAAMPALNGVLTAVILLLGFAMPPLLRLVDTSPVQILQGALQPPSQALWVVVVSVLLAVLGLLWLQAGDIALAGMVLLGLIAGVALFWVLAGWLLNGLQRLGKRAGWDWMPVLGRSRRAVLLVVVFATGLFALLLLTTVRTELLERWQETLPADAPDHFLINIQPAEVAPLRQFLAAQQVNAVFYPMIRGRLVAVNGKPVNSQDFQDQRAQRLLAREFNLSSFTDFPTSNVLLQGQWFDAGVKGISIEKSLGETLKFGMGDTLTFDIAGQQVTQPITSVREVRWDSMQPNFFVIAAPNSIDNMPQTYITSIHLGEKKSLVTALIRQFPSVTVIDVGAVLAQIRGLIEQVSMAVQGIFVFTLLSGVEVLVAALQSQQVERRREIAILKSLGARRGRLQRRIWGEFLLLGGLAGMLAGLLATTVGVAIGYFLFDLPPSLNMGSVLVGGISGSVLVGVAGYWNLRRLLDISPLELLKTA